MRFTDFDFVEIAHAQLTESELSSVFAYPRFLRILVWLAKPLPFGRAIINNISRVPAYLQGQKVVGFCDFLVKPLANDWRGVWGVVRSPFL